MVDSLAQSDEQIENVRVVVEHSARRHICIELRLRLGIDRLVVVGLKGVERILAEYDVFGRNDDIFRPPFLSTPQ